MKRYRKDQINELVNILKNDGVISVPTDTVFGICAQVYSKKSYRNLVIAKNRPSNKNFPIMCSSKEQIRKIAVVDERVEKLINAFMPGPITLVLNKKDEKLNNGGDRATTELAVRMAPTKILKDLIEKVGCPIFITSANQNGKEVCKNLEEIAKACPTLDGILEGEVSLKKASTIVDCTKEKIKIQRHGPIQEKEILEALKDEQISIS